MDEQLRDDIDHLRYLVDRHELSESESAALTRVLDVLEGKNRTQAMHP